MADLGHVGKRMSLKLSTLGETGFIEMIKRQRKGKPSLLHTGIGDDAAVIRRPNGYTLFSTDMMVEGTHFTLKTSSWEDIGWKAVASCGSDMAAMGGSAKWICLSLGVPPSAKIQDLRRLYRGIRLCADRLGAMVVGGDTVKSHHVVLDVAMIGEAPYSPKLRSTARVGDFVMVSGTLGEASLGWRLIRRGRVAWLPGAVRRFRRPVLRTEVGKSLGTMPEVRAMTDISDGLAMDLSHLCKASGVGVEVDECLLPVSESVRRTARRLGISWKHLVYGGGEDYELLWTCPPGAVNKIRKAIKSKGCRATVIGKIIRASQGLNIFVGSVHSPRFAGVAGRPLLSNGYCHF